MADSSKTAPYCFVFDLDGTLVDSGAAVLRAFRHAVEPWGLELGPNEFEKIRSRTSSTLFADFLPEEHAREALDRLEANTFANISQVRAFDGVYELLTGLREKGLKTAVWTARDRASALEILKHNGIQSCFDIVVGNCGVSRNKPEPDGLLLIARELGLEPWQMIHIGDHDHDVEGARKAGCLSAAVRWRPDFKTRPWPKASEAQPDLWFDRPNEILAHFFDPLH